MFAASLLFVLLTGCARSAGISGTVNPRPKNSSDAGPPAERVAESGSSPAAQWDDHTFTLLWYVNGSDLESGGGEGYGGAFTRNLQEVLAYPPHDNLFSVVIFSGGTSKWETPGFEAGVNQVHYVTKDGLTHGEQLPPGSIAEPKTLSNFIRYAMRARPAHRYGLIFWDHGSSAPIGFGLDELREPQSINVRNISRGLAEGLEGARLSFIGFDTCLMSTVETAALCAPYADYLIASEELEPNGGWNYSPLMSSLAQNPAADASELGAIIVDAFFDASLARNPEDRITLSVTDLSQIEPVVRATETFALAARTDLREGGFSGIAKGRAGAKNFGGVEESADMVDLVHLAQCLAHKYPRQSDELIAAVERSVVYNRHSENSPNSNGLSIYFPFENEAIWENYLDVYLDMGFTTSYAALVKEFSDQLRRRDTDFQRIEIPVTKGDDGRYAVRIPSGTRSRIVSVRAVLVGRESEGAYYIYSFIPDVEYRSETGKAFASLPSRWPGINGVPACARAEPAPDGRTLYSIPVKINDRDMNLMLSHQNGVFSLIGATPDGDEDQVPAPGILPIITGNVITLKYPRLEQGSHREEDGYYLGPSFPVSDGGPDVGFFPLPSGKYYLGFYLKDIYDNHFLTETVPIATG